MRHPFLHRLALLSMAPFAGSTAFAELPHSVAKFDATAPSPFTHGTCLYEYTTKEIPAEKLAIGASERRVLAAASDDILRARFTGLEKNARYELRMTFFSEIDRTINLHAGTTEIIGGVKIPALIKTIKTVDLPPDTYAEGVLRLAFSGSGKKPVLSALEVLSDSGKILKPEADTRSVLASIRHEIPRLTPKTQSVKGVQNARISLDGEWRFIAAGKENPIRVPGEWAMQGFTVKAGEPATYRKTITLPTDWKGLRVKLRFDAVSAECVVKMNGKTIGAHKGGFVPFEYDVTEAVTTGENTIEVAVRSETPADTLATMSQYAGHPVGGLLRTVTLFALPEVNIAGLDTETTFDATYRNATLSVNAEIANEGALPADAELVATLVSPSGKTLDLGSAATAPVSALPAQGRRVVKLKLPVPNVRAWDTEHPNLYTLELAVKRGGETLVSGSRRVGLRTVSLDGALMRINGKPVKLLGACRHEVDPLSGRSITAEQCRRDAELFRAGNANFLRTSHYPPSEAFLDACDELGILVESEAAICWVKHPANPLWTKWDHEDPSFLAPIAQASLDNIVANRGHASVVLWSIANESRWSPLFESVDTLIRHTDPTRPTAFHDQCWGGFNNAGSKAQVSVYHYPGEDGPAECAKTKDRPTYFGEYAHVQCYNRREWHTDPGVRADWGRPLSRMVDRMWEHPNCLGGAIWAAVDDIFHLPEEIGGSIVGYGPWGVIDAWRREKPEYTGMKNAYSRIRITTPVEFKNGAWRFRVQNRYDFADLSEVSIAWKSGTQKGVVRFEAAPHEEAEIVITPDSAPKEGDSLRLTFMDPRGFIALEREIGASVNSAGFGKRLPGKIPVELTESAPAYTLRAGHTSVTVNRKTGAMSVTGANGKTILAGLPVPMSLELNSSGGAGGPAGSVFVNDIAPFTPVDVDWKATSVVAARVSENSVRVDVAGENKDARGVVSLTVLGDGALRFDYDCVSTRNLNPRQRGLAFELPRRLDTLRWIRTTADASFDPNDIGRKYGTAKANPSALPLVYEPRKRPTTPWALDASPLGTNDFRSTKVDIRAASLSDETGAGIAVESDGSQAARAWVDGDRVRLLVADFNTGGCDGFFQTHYAKERRPIKTGDKLTGGVTLLPMEPR